jgi:hypothetical protein
VPPLSNDARTTDPDAYWPFSDIMTIDVSSTRPSTRWAAFVRLRDRIKRARANDRVVLAGFFASLFLLYYRANLLNLIAGDILPASRTLSGAEILGFLAIASVLKDLKADCVLRWWDLLAIVGIMIACIHPSHSVGAIGMTCLGLLLIARSDKRLASLGQLCIGLAWIDIWGPLALRFIEHWLLPIETALASLPLSLFGTFLVVGNIISNGNGHGIEVLEPCSAFHNTIITAFIWLSLMKIQKVDFHLQHFCILAIALAATVLLNTARISVMAISYSQYMFWHQGFGLVIVKVMMLSIVFGLFLFGLRNSRRQKRT